MHALAGRVGVQRDQAAQLALGVQRPALPRPAQAMRPAPVRVLFGLLWVFGRGQQGQQQGKLATRQRHDPIRLARLQMRHRPGHVAMVEH